MEESFEGKVDNYINTILNITKTFSTTDTGTQDKTIKEYLLSIPNTIFGFENNKLTFDKQALKQDFQQITDYTKQIRNIKTVLIHVNSIQTQKPVTTIQSYDISLVQIIGIHKLKKMITTALVYFIIKESKSQLEQISSSSTQNESTINDLNEQINKLKKLLADAGNLMSSFQNLDIDLNEI